MWLAIQTPASALTPHTPPPSFYQNPISMQAQEKAQWSDGQTSKAGGYNAQVMPRGDGGPAPDAQDTGLVPLLIFGGLLLIGVAGFFLHSKKRVL